MFGRDPITPIAKLLEPKLKFYGKKGIGVNMNTLRKLYTVVAENICRAREKQPRQETQPMKLQVNDLVMVKYPESAVFDPKYMPNYRITAVYGRNQIEVQDEKGNKSVRRAAHVKTCEPVDKVINQLLPQTVYEQYGKSSKLLIHPRDVPEIQLQLFNGQHQGELGKIDNCDESQNREETDDTVHEISKKDGGVMKLRNTHPMTSDTVDESRSRRRQQHVGEKCCDVNMVTVDSTHTDIDSIDESRNRLNIVTLAGGVRKLRPLVKRSSVCNQDDIDTSDTLRSRCHKSALDVMFDSEQELLKLTDDNTEVIEQESVEQTGNPGPKVHEPDEELRSRQARCSMSTDMQMQQPVTFVIQSGSIDTTVVNKQDIDKCLETNKHTNVKQDSIPMSNQWLSNAFSKITFGIWDKSKTKTGVEVTENVNTNIKTKLTFTPEFNFPL